ncbi:hypothetical protein GCM10009790_03420 [Georgenia ruanii]
MESQAPSCAGVGAAKAPSNHARVGSENGTHVIVPPGGDTAPAPGRGGDGAPCPGPGAAVTARPARARARRRLAPSLGPVCGARP